MHGINQYLNQPMMIEQNYLMSVLSSLVLGFKTNSFESSEKINEKFLGKIESHMSSMEATGATQFPVVINIIGPIIKYSDWYYTGTQTILNICKLLEIDDRVSGVLFNIDSGGGMGDGTGELADYIFNMKTPTIGYSNGYVCSAAAYLFAATKLRILNPYASKIGSFGSYIPYANYDGIYEKLGAVIKDIYATDSPEKNIAWRQMVENNNPKLFEEMATDFNKQFLGDVKRFYGKDLKDDGKVFQGAIYNPDQALEIGLVHELATIDMALQNF